MKLILICISVLFAASCYDNSLKGKIEKRGEEYYLVNSSTDKVYQFTIKEVNRLGDSVSDYTTYTTILSPGELQKLNNPGAIKSKPAFNPNNPYYELTAKYFTVGNETYLTSEKEVNDFKKDFPNAAPLPDGLIPDSFKTYQNIHAIPITTFEVTGQLEIKNINEFLNNKRKYNRQ